MRFWLTLGLFVVSMTSMEAMGFTEDPGELQKRTFEVAPFVELSIRGEITLEVRQGDHYSVTVQASRALFDQIRIFSFLGFASVAVETGLLGPREPGSVLVWITLPRLEKLTVFDQSSAVVDWPGESANVVLRDRGTLDLSFSGGAFHLVSGSKTHARVTGSAAEVDLVMRLGGRLDATLLKIGRLKLELDEESIAQLGAVGSWSGTLRHGARADVPVNQTPQGRLDSF